MTNKVRQVIDVVDTERQEIFQLLKDLPDEETRVIGVINKCDTKQKKSHDWVCSCPHFAQLGCFDDV
jgi:predicted GTPase